MENVKTATAKTAEGNGVSSTEPLKIALIGNPNVGKSVIFGILTGRYVNVSNYPGTTVEVSRGTGRVQKRYVSYIDTPGTNSFIPGSEDERVTRDILLNEEISAVLQVADAKNLKRALLLSLQMSEMGIPFILDLNMMDELETRGMHIDTKMLAEIAGVAVLETTAIRRKGTDRIMPSLENARPGLLNLRYPAILESAIGKIVDLLPEKTPFRKKALAIMLLVRDEGLAGWVKRNLDASVIKQLQKIIWDLESELKVSVIRTVNEARFRYVSRIYDRIVTRNGVMKVNPAGKLDAVVSHPVWGVPVLAVALYLVYQIVGVIGAGFLVDFFENTIFGKIINPAAVWFFTNIVPVPFLQDLFVGPYGLITMALGYGFAIVLPIVTAFFLVFSVLEDSGYLPRLALLVNRLFKLFGLNGKAVLPMVLGLGCDTMATMSARILETRKERIIVVLLLALGVPCSAQLGVILGMTALLPWQATLLWFAVITVVMLIVGTLSARIIPGAKSDFILELPPLRMPVLSNIVNKTMARIEWYIKEVVPVFVLGTLILFCLDRVHALVWIEKISSPIIQDFLGLPARATESFLIGFLRRDYGAAGLFSLAGQGFLTNNQIIVSIVTITLFIPCIANFLMIIKELGLKIAVAMAFFIVPFAFGVGGLLNIFLNFTGIRF
jgi:ferrous iron transport protein B